MELYNSLRLQQKENTYIISEVNHHYVFLLTLSVRYKRRVIKN